MDKITNAAIILLGIGEKAAADIMKTMDPKEVRAVIEAINSIDNVTEEDVIRALNEFFSESNNSAGIDRAAKEQVKNTLFSAISERGLSNVVQSSSDSQGGWLELLKMHPMNAVYDLIKYEHPQVITAIMIIIFNNISGEYGTKLLKVMPKEMQSQIFKRMTHIGYISKFAVDALSVFFKEGFDESEGNNIVTVDGLETIANMISYMDSETEHSIMSELVSENKNIGELIQDKRFPFHRLAELDKKSLQTLLSEVKNEDLVLALKGTDESVKVIFMANISSKSAEILNDDMSSSGPVKIAHVLDAQKNIIRLAKKLAQDEKIILATKDSPDIIF